MICWGGGGNKLLLLYVSELLLTTEFITCKNKKNKYIWYTCRYINLVSYLQINHVKQIYIQNCILVDICDMHRYICPLSQRILKTFNCKEGLSYFKKKKKSRFFKFSINFVRTCLIQKSGISFKKGIFFLKAEIYIFIFFNELYNVFFFLVL